MPIGAEGGAGNLPRIRQAYDGPAGSCVPDARRSVQAGSYHQATVRAEAGVDHLSCLADQGAYPSPCPGVPDDNALPAGGQKAVAVPAEDHFGYLGVML